MKWDFLLYCDRRTYSEPAGRHLKLLSSLKIHHFSIVVLYLSIIKLKHRGGIRAYLFMAFCIFLPKSFKWLYKHGIRCLVVLSSILKENLI